MPELRSGVRRGRASRKLPTDNNQQGQQIDGQKVTNNRGGTRGRRPEYRANNTTRVRARRNSNNRKKAAAIYDEKVEVVRVSSQRKPSLEDKELDRKEGGPKVRVLGGGGGGCEGGIREEVGEREMDEYDSGGGAVGRSADRGLGEDDGTTAPLPEKVSNFL